MAWYMAVLLTDMKKFLSEIFYVLNKFKKGLIQFFKFQLVSVVSYWCDFGIYSLIYTFSPLDYIGSKIISYCCGIFIAYTINKGWTFGVKKEFISKRIIKSYTVSAIALCANLLCMYILNTYYAIDPYLAQLAATLFSFIINFSGNKLWVF